MSTVLALVLVVAKPAHAKWDDNSGDLPGISSTKALVLTTAAVTGAIVALMYWNKNKKRSGAETPATTASPSLSAQAAPLDVAGAGDSLAADAQWLRVVDRYHQLSTTMDSEVTRTTGGASSFAMTFVKGAAPAWLPIPE